MPTKAATYAVNPKPIGIQMGQKHHNHDIGAIPDTLIIMRSNIINTTPHPIFTCIFLE